MTIRIAHVELLKNTFHFMFECDNYSEHRRIMNIKLTDFGNLSLNDLLFGDESLSIDQNTSIFNAVQSYITSTNRF